MTRFRVPILLLLCAGGLVAYHLSRVPLAGTGIAQGFYGTTSTYDDTTALGHRLAHQKVCVVSDDQLRRVRAAQAQAYAASGGSAESGIPMPPRADDLGASRCTRADGDGVYRLEVPPGPRRMCVVFDNQSFACDPCLVTVHPGQKVRRDFMAGPGGGTWLGDFCREQLSI